MLSSAIEWFALQVKTRSEHRVAAMLRSKGYEEFLPTYRVQKRNARLMAPLFPGYIFCRINPYAHGLIVTTPGVIRFVEFGGRPAPIDSCEIQSLQLIVNSGVPTSVLRGLHVGDRIRIQDGPLRGVVGILVSMRAQQRLVVSITMMMRTVSAEVSPEWVTALEPLSGREDFAA